MGQRANLIIVNSEGYELYYDHYCANAIDQYLFWGEESSVDFFRKHEIKDESAWLDTIWCEGGALIDLDRKVLLLFGGEDIRFEITLREIYLHLLQYTWPGYTIRWAHSGIIDLAEYVGVPREKVISPASLEIGTPVEEGTILYTFAPVRKANTFQSSVLRPVGEPSRKGDVQTHFSPERVCVNEAEGICSLMKGEESLLFYPMEQHGIGLEVLLGGERLLKCLEKSQPREPESILYLGGFPGYGIHIDLLKKELCFWWSVLPFQLRQLSLLWPGWKVIPWEGNYRRHTAASKGSLQFPAVDIEEMLANIEKIVSQSTCEHVFNTLQTMKIFTECGFNVDANPNILCSEYFACPTQSKQIFKQIKYFYLQSIGAT